MPKFHVTLDVKETIWNRCRATIEAATLKDAQKEVIRRRENDEYEDMENDYLFDTFETLSKEKLYLLGNVDTCLPDFDGVKEEIAAIEVYNFPVRDNYKLEDSPAKGKKISFADRDLLSTPKHVCIKDDHDCHHCLAWDPSIAFCSQEAEKGDGINY